jgi:hypothetical protein
MPCNNFQRTWMPSQAPSYRENTSKPRERERKGHPRYEPKPLLHQLSNTTAIEPSEIEDGDAEMDLDEQDLAGSRPGASGTCLSTPETIHHPSRPTEKSPQGLPQLLSRLHRQIQCGFGNTRKYTERTTQISER